MTLRKLLNSCRYKDVFNILHQVYYKTCPVDSIYAADMSYRKVCDGLSELPSKISKEYQIYIREIEENIDVSLYCSEEEQVYGVDFTPWEDLIDADIKKDLPLDDCTLLAHILWEITFYAFSASALQREKGKIQKELDNLEGD